MTDKYAVIGDPVEHSLSPVIHQAFASETGEDISYERIQVPLNSFTEQVCELIAEEYRGLNVTVPLKQEAFQLAEKNSERAITASAVNTLSFENGWVLGDNTDGVGLIRDLEQNLGCTIHNKAILLLGAGGAARGILEPLLARNPNRLVIANRTESRAEILSQEFPETEFATLDSVFGEFELIINATSASLAGGDIALNPEIINGDCLCYDLMYTKKPTPFMQWGSGHGANVSDGLGMLVEQAAEAFYVWRKVRPTTQKLIATLRAEHL
jgi:shikimate dehydrogenase